MRGHWAEGRKFVEFIEFIEFVEFIGEKRFAVGGEPVYGLTDGEIKIVEEIVMEHTGVNL
jgi:hypothetical protein